MITGKFIIRNLSDGSGRDIYSNFWQEFIIISAYSHNCSHGNSMYPPGQFAPDCKIIKHIIPGQSPELGLSGDWFRFDGNGDGPARYNIIHFKQVSPSKYRWIRVGEYLEGTLNLNMSGKSCCYMVE
ncbi:mangetout, partial [Carabus blaptoides fortunei]